VAGVKSIEGGVCKEEEKPDSKAQPRHPNLPPHAEHAEEAHHACKENWTEEKKASDGRKKKERCHVLNPSQIRC
jgi:hypothetical protein